MQVGQIGIAYLLSPLMKIWMVKNVDRAAPRERERSVYRKLGIPSAEMLRLPRGVRLRGARRPLRVRPEAASCEPVGDGAVRLAFALPPGSYATVLVEELLAGLG